MEIQTRFSASPYAGERDIQPICDLINSCSTADGLTGESYASPEDTRVWLSSPDILDKERDLRLWRDASGRVVGFGQMRIAREPEDGKVDAYLYFRVHPETRNNSLEEEILGWAAERALAVGRDMGIPAHLRTGLHLTTPEYIAYRQGLLERHGFAPIRYGYKMERSLNEPLPEARFPEGFTLRHAEGEADLEPWVEMCNQTFIDHWNFHPTTVEEHKHWLSSPNYNPELDLICIASDGTFAAFAFCGFDPADNAANNRSEGWIYELGTRRGFRKIGLGRATLLAGMKKLKEAGLATAVLGVDSENPTGALGLYESVGFTKVSTGVTYHKDL